MRSSLQPKKPGTFVTVSTCTKRFSAPPRRSLPLGTINIHIHQRGEKRKCFASLALQLSGTEQRERNTNHEGKSYSTADILWHHGDLRHGGLSSFGADQEKPNRTRQQPESGQWQ